MKSAFRGSLTAALVLATATAPAADSPTVVPTDLFAVPDGMEVTVWAASPMLANPTNMDIDEAGRIWVAEGVNYRRHAGRRPEGDRIVVLEDTNGDGKADKSWTFVQEKELIAPLGVAVIGNQIIVSQPPNMIVYTDVNRNQKFDPGTDKREVLLTGFNGQNHDHSLHSVTAGPDGQWYWNMGNTGAKFTDKSGKTFRVGSPYAHGDSTKQVVDSTEIAGQKSDDGHVYIGGFAARMKPDGSQVRIIGFNFRNSYEQTVTSFGDVFQSDNDDPPACRVSYQLEFGNAGFASADGQRAWAADKRPGQTIPIAEWRQEDPGTFPVGDVYGGGSPTGVAFYENGALGKKWQGLLLTCEAGRNVVFGYLPKLTGAGFKLERFDFLTSNREKKFAGSDFLGGANSVTSELKTLFRPSDVCVGPDGAIYVTDWFDARVGGHQDLDDTMSGAIYRIAPKGFKSSAPKLNLDTIAGQMEALKSPAINVRNAGFVRLKAQGDKAVAPVGKLLKDENPFIAARAVWLLAQMGDRGVTAVRALLNERNEQTRVVAYRALVRQGIDVANLSARFAKDASPAVRREVALAQRDIPAAQSLDVLVEIGSRFDGSDRTYLEAFGTGCFGKEQAVYDALLKKQTGSNAADWSEAFGWITWRLHPATMVNGLKQRALAANVPKPQRKLAVDALAFIPSAAASQAMLDLAAQTDFPFKAEVVWWLFSRKDSDWKEFGLLEKMKQQGIYDPDKIELVAMVVPDPKDTPNTLPPVEKILALKGDPKRGLQIATACQTCHQIGADGAEYGPALTSFGQTQTSEVIVNSIVNPSSDIAHGFDGVEVVTKSGAVIHGIALSRGDPMIIKSTGGVTQTVPKNQIKSQKKLDRSLMLSASQLGLTVQDVADVTAYLKSIK